MPNSIAAPAPTFGWLLLSIFFALYAPYTFARDSEPELVVQSGHARPISSVVFSPDGTLLASHSEDDNTLRIWSAIDGTQLRILQGVGYAGDLAFTDDSTSIAALTTTGQVTFWNVRSGKVERTYGTSVSAFAISSKMLLQVSDICTVYNLDSNTSFPLENCAADIGSPTFSQDGSWIAAERRDSIQLWSAATGKFVRTLSADAYVSALVSIAFNPDGTLVAMHRQNGITLHDPKTGLFVRRLAGHGLKRCITFSPDGHRVLAGGNDHLVHVWDVATGAALEPLRGHTDWVTAVAYSPDGQQIASGGADRSLIVWSASTLKQSMVLAGRVSPVRTLAFSPTSPLLVTGHHDGTVTLWDARDGYNVRILSPNRDLVSAAALLGPVGLMGYKDWNYREISALEFSDDGLHLAVGSHDGTVRIWNLESGTEVSGPPRVNGWVRTLSFSADGAWIAITTFDGDASIWDIRRQLAVALPWKDPRPLVALEFYTGRTVVAADATRRTLEAWDVDKQALVQSVSDLPADLTVVRVNHQGHLATVANNHDTIVVDLVAGSKRRLSDGLEIRALSFASDGAKVAIASGTGMCVSTLQTGKRSCIPDGQARREALALNSTGSLLASSGADGIVDIWDVQSGASAKLRLHLFSLADTGWMAVAPDGLFDGVQSAWDAAVWRLSHDSVRYVPVEAFFNEFFHPELLRDVLTGHYPNAVVNLADKDIRQPALQLSSVAPSNRTDQTTAEVLVHVVEAPADRDHPTTSSGATDVRLFRNGSLAKAWKGDALGGHNSVTLSATVPLLPGPNRFTAYAFNSEGVKSRNSQPLLVHRSRLIVPQRTLYVISIGIDKYSDPRLELRYATADAKMFGGELEVYQRELDQFAKVKVFYLLDGQATKRRIIGAIRGLSARTASYEGPDLAMPPDWGPAAVQDVVVVYFAGHGTSLGDRYFLLPNDLQTRNNQALQQIEATILDEAVSDDELASAIEPIQAAKILVIIDACDSGRLLGADKARVGPLNVRGFAQMAFERGMSVVAAAKDGQFAREPNSLGHGILTYALIEEALKRARVPATVRGEITEQSWLQYAVTAVPRIYASCCSQRQDPTVGRKVAQGARKFTVDGKAVLPTTGASQQARVFYGRSADESWTIRYVAPKLGDDADRARKAGDVFVAFLAEHKFAEAHRILSTIGKKELSVDVLQFLWLELERQGGEIYGTTFRSARADTTHPEAGPTLELLYTIEGPKGHIFALLRGRLYDRDWLIDSFAIRDDIR